jgi:hypothetical protein
LPNWDIAAAVPYFAYFLAFRGSFVPCLTLAELRQFHDGFFWTYVLINRRRQICFLVNNNNARAGVGTVILGTSLARPRWCPISYRFPSSRLEASKSCIYNYVLFFCLLILFWFAKLSNLFVPLSRLFLVLLLCVLQHSLRYSDAHLHRLFVG